MNDVVYGIFSGCYSDWNTHGFFTDREEADKYCALKNEGNDDYDRYYVKSLNSLVNNIDLSNVILKYEHEIVFDINNGQYIMRDEPTRYEYYTGERRLNYVNKPYKHWIVFKVNLDENNRVKAEKIAQDRLAEYKAYIAEGVDKQMILNLMNNKGENENEQSDK